MRKLLKNQKGLTLIELLAVIVILAIIAAIAIPAIGNIIENQRIKAIKADAANIISAAQIYYSDNGSAALFTLIEPASGVTTIGGTGASYVDIGNTEVSGTISVTKDGQIYGGSLEKNGKTLEFTATATTLSNAATLSSLQVDSKEISGTGWTIN